MTLQLFTHIEINMIGIFILTLIVFNIKKHLKRYQVDVKFFMLTVTLSSIMLIVDTIMITVDGKTGFLIREIHIFVSVLYYALHSIPFMLWALYVDFQIYKDENRIKKLLVPAVVPVCIIGVLSVLSIFGNMMFYIDENNLYNRGNLFFLSVVVSYIYPIYTFINIMLKKNMIKKKDYHTLLGFAFIPFISGILQIMFYGTTLIWIGMSLSLLIVFINIQNNHLYTDHLTGLYNRRQLDDYLKNCIKSNKKNSLIAAIMIDINSFKDINDIYGHAEGDRAIEYASEIIKKSFRKDDFIARYGGDEFVVVIEVEKYSELTKLVMRLKENIEKFNSRKITPYIITFSMGYDVFNCELGMTIEQFFKYIDDLMYQDKKNSKKSIS